MEFAISQPKMVRLPRNEKQTYRLNSRAQMWPSVWPWPWPWPWIFKVKYRICYISAKNGPIATKRKANISIELQASNVTNGFELDHNRDLWILKVKRDLDHGFSWSNFEIAVSQNGRVDWHSTKEVAVGHSWPWSWPFGDQVQVYGSTR